MSVSSLTASAVKEGMAVYCSPTAAVSPLVMRAVSDAPQGLALQTLAGVGAPRRLAQLLASGSLTSVVAVDPSSSIEQLASQYADVHFFFVGRPQAGEANVTWLVPQVTDSSASYAGYIAGTVTSPASVIAAVYHGSVETSQQAALVTDIRSGVHASFSTATVLPVSGGRLGHTVHTLGALIVLGTSPLSSVAAVPVTIGLAQETDEQVRLPAGSLLSYALATIWKVGIHSSWPDLAPFALPAPVWPSGYLSPASERAVATYAKDLQGRLILPAQFALLQPSWGEAHALGLPVH